MKKLYVIAGEPSGDLHGANLVKELKGLHPDLQVRAWGGEQMEAAGAELVKHYRDLAFMGFVEVILNIRTILRNIAFCKADLLEFKPDAVVLIDYPGFNLRIAEFCHVQGVPVHYYISPQIWAWKQNRVYKIREVVDRMYVILPFEAEFYERFNYEVSFVGHPLLDVIAQKERREGSAALFRQQHSPSGEALIALLPGSRKQEIKRMLPLMLECVDAFPNARFVIGGAPSQDEAYYRQFLKSYSRVELVFGETYELMRSADAGLVTSGTATLEAALWGLPEVVCYKGSTISYWIARMLIKVKYISLVNLVMDKVVVTELIQSDLSKKNMVRELKSLLEDRERQNKLGSDYVELRAKLGGAGASLRTAKEISERVYGGVK